MRIKVFFIILVLIGISFSSGCTNKNPNNTTDSGTPTVTSGAQATPTAQATPSVTTAAQETPDVVTTASIVNTEKAFLNAISKDGTWIIATLNDLTLEQELLLEGEFTNGKKDDSGKEIVQRKIALYSQDENRTITAKYILTAPKLTVTSPEASIQHGTFIGDLYVSVDNFQLVDATVDGNVYFTTEEAKSTFQMDENSSITGTQELKQ